jgi:hypothetical protein
MAHGEIDSVSDKHQRLAHMLRKTVKKAMVIKVQVPYEPGFTGKLTGPLLVYDKSREFVCQVHRDDDPKAYDAVSTIVRSRGVGGAKAYFAAELMAEDRLVVKTSEVLAAQPFLILNRELALPTCSLTKPM